MMPLLFMAMLIEPSPAVRCLAERPGATASLARADAATARRDPRTANRALDQGLRMLGEAYQRPETDDDTGMHLVLADVAARKGQWTRAAMLKRRILVERLSLCGQPRRR